MRWSNNANSLGASGDTSITATCVRLGAEALCERRLRPDIGTATGVYE